MGGMFGGRPQGSISAYTPSLAERMQSGLAGGLQRLGVDPRYARHLAQRGFSFLNDVTPLGNVTMAADAGTAIRNGHPLQGLGMGALAVLPGALGKGGKGVMRKYPMAPRGEWYSDADYAARGGRLVEMPVDDFIKQARPLKIDESSRDNIDDLKNHIQSGRLLDPLMLGAGRAGHDGRHRAYAAKELGISTVPVLIFGK